jgi:TonB-linked SusC/RagA family outer membrane protein
MQLNAFSRECSAIRGILPKTLRVMQITTVLLLGLCLQTAASGLSQTITFSGKEVPLEKVFAVIKDQTGYFVSYKSSQVRRAKPVTIYGENMPIGMFLSQVLKDQQLEFTIQENTIFIKWKNEMYQHSDFQPISGTLASPADINLSGRVTNAKKEPLEGVSVTIKGTQAGTTTNADGRFRLSVPSDNVELIFSFVGYAMQTVKAAGRTVFDIVLEEAVSSLSDVVVVGYGTQKKINLTGAVDQISGDRLTNRPIVKVSQALQGLMANVNVVTPTGGGKPGTSLSINVRGYTGLGTTGSPLILIDGVEADINAINPNDIESISVLKDAASSAIYGSRAPYGVILVTTKMGKRESGIKVSYNSNISYSQTIHRPIPANSLDFATVINEAANNAGRANIISDATVEKIKAHLADPSSPATEVDLGAGRSYLWLGYFGSYANTDWYDVFTKDWATNQLHNIGISGGSDKTTYYIGLGYAGAGAICNYFDDSYDQYNFRANISSQVNSWLKFGIRTSYSKDSIRSPTNSRGGWSGLYTKMVTSPVTVPTGGYWRDGVTFIQDGGATLASNQKAWIMGDVTITPLPGMEIKGSYNYNYNTWTNVAAANDILYQTTDGSYRSYNIIPSINKSNEVSTFINYNFYASYEKKLSGHYFKIMAGYQQEHKNYQLLNAGNNYTYSPTLPSLTLTYGTNYSVSDALYEWATSGIFTRFNYNYKEKYLLEFNGRYDGTSLFPSNRRWQFFPSISAGYNIAREAYWDDLSNILSTLKIRASYGMLGDISSLINSGSYYLSQPSLSTSAPGSTNWLFGGAQQPTVKPGSLVSSEVTWAKPSMLDIGVDIGALDERLQFSFDWYHRKIKDLYGPVQQYPGILGVSAPQINNASVETKGFDMTTSWSDHWGALNYSLRFILSNYKGKVLSYPNPTGSTDTWYNGQAMGSIWGYETVGLFQSEDEISHAAPQTIISSNWYPGDVQYKDLNGDNKIDYGNNTLNSPGDRKIIGNTTPQYSYGFTLTLDYKGFDLQAFLQGVGKRDFWPGMNSFFWGIPGSGSEWASQVLVTNLNRWTTETPDGYFPKYYLNSLNAKNQQAQTRYLLNAAYLRFKNLQLGYTFPSRLTRRAHVGKLRVYGSIENLFTISPGLDKKFQIDPELLISDGNIYPISRAFAIGVNLDIQ